MIIDTMMFFLGVALFTLGPFIAVYSYYEGADGPTCFAVGMILFASGVGILAGFAA